MYILRSAPAASLPPDTDVKVLCNASCEQQLDSLEAKSTSTGLRYKDIKVGSGPAPPVGYQARLTQHCCRSLLSSAAAKTNFLGLNNPGNALCLLDSEFLS